MRKAIVLLTVAAFALTLAPMSSTAKVNRKPGGLPAFFVGCCWGLREGTEWNEGADMHWREWFRIVPYLGIVFMLWDGVDCASGTTAHEWAEQNGANWY